MNRLTRNALLCAFGVWLGLAAVPVQAAEGPSSAAPGVSSEAAAVFAALADPAVQAMSIPLVSASPFDEGPGLWYGVCSLSCAPCWGSGPCPLDEYGEPQGYCMRYCL